jgi:hypothetical protein
VQAAEVSTEIVTQALLRVHQATVVLRAVALQAAVLATEVTVDHQVADHQVADHPLAVLVDMVGHPAVGHPAVGHPAVGRVVTVVPPAEVHQQEMLARVLLLLTAQDTVQQLVMVVADRDRPE